MSMRHPHACDCPLCAWADADYARLADHPVDAATLTYRRAFIRRWMDARHAERAVAQVQRLAPYLRSGATMSEARAAEMAVAARARYELRDGDSDDGGADGRVCCSECGAAFDAAVWDGWYPDADCRPDDDALLCAACAFGGDE